MEPIARDSPFRNFTSYQKDIFVLCNLIYIEKHFFPVFANIHPDMHAIEKYLGIDH